MPPHSLIYLHKLSFPFGADFSQPELYGFARKCPLPTRSARGSPPLTDLPRAAAGKVLPLNLTTADNVRIGAWQVLPKSFYDDWTATNGVPASGALPPAAFELAAKVRPLSLAWVSLRSHGS